MHIYLVRHTTPSVAPGICYGRTDLDLAPEHPSEMAAIQAILPQDYARYPVYTSPLNRCRRLAQYLHAAPQPDERLLELDFGSWEMQPWGEIPQPALQAWMNDFTHHPTPSGDSYEALYARVQQFWDEITGLQTPMVTVVTHAGVLQSLLSLLLDIPLSKSFRLQVGYGGVLEVKYQPPAIKLKFLKG